MLLSEHVLRSRDLKQKPRGGHNHLQIKQPSLLFCQSIRKEEAWKFVCPNTTLYPESGSPIGARFLLREPGTDWGTWHLDGEFEAEVVAGDFYSVTLCDLVGQ